MLKFLERFLLKRKSHNGIKGNRTGSDENTRKALRIRK